jgi:HlyD family secretion protein
MKNFFKNYWALLIPVIIVLIALVFFLKPSVKDESDKTVIGMVDATTIDVASSVPGKLDSLLVNLGDTVQQGQLLGVLKTTEINAIRSQALAGIEATQAQLDLLKQGPRKELIEATDKLYGIAQDQYDLFSKTYDRMQRLYNAEVISGQERDIFYFKYQAAKKEMETAKLNLDMLRSGTRPEVLKSAEALAKQAQEVYNLTNSLKENASIYAPATGVISTLVIHEGEIISIGYPVMTIEKSNSSIIRFNVRQNQINKLQPGTVLKVDVPGCTPQQFSCKVYSIAPSLEFANWVPAKQKGEFELRTFTVELKPNEAVSGLRSGMTAALKL